MNDAQTSQANSSLLVVFHDVAPVFEGELARAIAAVRRIVGSRFSCAAVPRWHGERPGQGIARMLEIAGECDEWLVHGLTHRREHSPGLVSRLTNRSDEFGGLTLAEIQQHIDAAKDELETVCGSKVHGLVPPAWQLPVAAVQLQRLSYVMGFRRLESCRDGAIDRRLATWSYDWGWLKSAAWAGHAMGVAAWKLTSDAIPCVVIHPADVARGWLPFILKQIERLLDSGCRPTTPGALMTPEET
ncbi:MAG: hypothetical protein R3C19_11760 [Planctomycetaceae bacterium]